MSRFDYVKYDHLAEIKQASLKAATSQLEALVEKELPSGRAKALILTKLEEAYMWMGKAVRDEQIARTGVTELQENRTSS